MKISKNSIMKICIFFTVLIIIFLFVKKDYFLYSKAIGTVTDVTTAYSHTETGYDGLHEYKEKYYKQKITVLLRNTANKGKYVTTVNEYSTSLVYDSKFKRGDDVFMENIEKRSNAKSSDLTGSITDRKRDVYFVFTVSLLFGLFLLIGKKDGLLTVFSLIINMMTFFYVIHLYSKGINLLLLVIPMVLFFTAMLLFFMFGKSKEGFLSFASTLISVAVTTIIAVITIHFSYIDYDFMDYLAQPYEQTEANCIFLSEIIIGCLGAITDIVVTIVMTVSQIIEIAPETDSHSLRKACRNVGDDIIGTMIAVMFFTNIAASLPFVLLSMRNGIALKTIIRYNIFFELSRFLTGSIGIVISIPVSSFIVINFYKRRIKKCC